MPPPAVQAAAAVGQRVLVLNAGSSSLKFKTFTLTGSDLEPGMGGVFERIGDEANSCLLAKGVTPTGDKKKWDIKVPAKDHVVAMQTILGFLKENVSANIAKVSTAMATMSSLHTVSGCSPIACLAQAMNLRFPISWFSALLAHCTLPPLKPPCTGGDGRRASRCARTGDQRAP